MRIWVGAVAALVAGGAVSGVFYIQGRSDARPVVQVIEARKQTLEVTVNGAGYVYPAQRVYIRSVVSSPTITLLAKPGSQVKQGDVVASMADTDLRLAAAQAGAELSRAQAQYDMARVQSLVEPDSRKLALQEAENALTLAVLELKKLQARAGVITDQALEQVADARQVLRQAQVSLGKAQLDPAVTDGDLAALLQDITAAQQRFDTAQARVASGAYDGGPLDLQGAQLRLSAARMQLAGAQLSAKQSEMNPDRLGELADQVGVAQVAKERAEQNLAGAIVKAPVSGLVLDWAVVDGQAVSPGSALLSLQVGGLQAKLRVDEAAAASMQFGQVVTLSSDALPGAVLSGKVEAIEPQSTAMAWGNDPLSGTPGTPAFIATVGLEAPPGALRSGMSVVGRITTLRVADVLAVPRYSVVESRGQLVIFVWSNGVVRERSVTLGRHDAKNVEIIAGVEQGDKVIVGTTEELTALRDGLRADARTES